MDGCIRNWLIDQLIGWWIDQMQGMKQEEARTRAIWDSHWVTRRKEQEQWKEQEDKAVSIRDRLSESFLFVIGRLLPSSAGLASSSGLPLQQQ